MGDTLNFNAKMPYYRLIASLYFHCEIFHELLSTWHQLHEYKFVSWQYFCVPKFPEPISNQPLTGVGRWPSNVLVYEASPPPANWPAAHIFLPIFAPI